jgi:hypothetical protein
MVRELHCQVLRAALAFGLAVVTLAPLAASPGEPERSRRGAVRTAAEEPPLPPCRVVRRRLWSDQDGWIVRRVPDCR